MPARTRATLQVGTDAPGDMVHLLPLMWMTALAATPGLWPEGVEHRYVVQVRTDYGGSMPVGDESRALVGLSLVADLRCRAVEPRQGASVRCDIADASVWAMGSGDLTALLPRLEGGLERGQVEMTVDAHGRLGEVRMVKTGLGSLEPLVERSVRSALSPLDLSPPRNQQEWTLSHPMAFRPPCAEAMPTDAMVTVRRTAGSPTIRWSGRHDLPSEEGLAPLTATGFADWDAEHQVWARSALRVQELTDDGPWQTLATVRRLPRRARLKLDPSGVLSDLPSTLGANSYRL